MECEYYFDIVEKYFKSRVKKRFLFVLIRKVIDFNTSKGQNLGIGMDNFSMFKNFTNIHVYILYSIINN